MMKQFQIFMKAKVLCKDDSNQLEVIEISWTLEYFQKKTFFGYDFSTN